MTIDGKAKYLCSSTKSHPSNRSYSSHPHTELFQFAEDSLLALSQANPSVIVKDSIVRVDVFQNNIGRMVVNEFESLEAGVYCGDKSGMVKEGEVDSCMSIFFMNRLLRYLEL